MNLWSCSNLGRVRSARAQYEAQDLIRRPGSVRTVATLLIDAMGRRTSVTCSRNMFYQKMVGMHSFFLGVVRVRVILFFVSP